tara:strand:+ start:79 stop:1779 length:1701 start_codon:yes stop_codon:yes gene_type:complete
VTDNSSNQPTAYSYIRFSTVKQSQGDSLRRQTEAAQAYCNEHNLHLDDSYKDFGSSAYKGHHLGEDAGLGQFLAACETGSVSKGSYLIIESLDRLSRQHVQVALRQLLNILSYQITVITLLDEQVYTHLSDTTSLIISITIMSRAHEESAMKSKRLLATWDNKRNTVKATKLTANCPFWLTLSTDRTHFVLNERLEALNVIYQMATDGHGGRAIARYLNEHHSKLAKGKSGKWYESGIFVALRSRAVLGEFQPHKHEPNDENIIRRVPVGAPILDYYPQAITNDTYYLAQKSVQSRAIGKGKQTGAGRKGKHFKNLLQGIVKCNDCGANYVLQTVVSKTSTSSKTTRKLTCSNRLRPNDFETKCGNALINLDDIQKYALSYVVRDLIKKYSRSTAITGSPINASNDTTILQSQLDAAQDVLGSFLAMTTDFSNPIIKDKFTTLSNSVNELKRSIELINIEKVQPIITADDIRLTMANALQETVEGVEPTLNKSDVMYDTELYNSRLKLNRLVHELLGDITIKGVTKGKRYQVIIEGKTTTFTHDEVNTAWYLATAIWPKLKGIELE